MLRLRLGVVVVALWAASVGCKSTGESGSGGAGGQGGSSTGIGLQGAGATTTTGTAGGGPLSCLQAYTNIPHGVCDLLAQDCPPGQTCNANSDANPTATVCVAGAGLKGPGETCKAHTECRAGLICTGQCTSACCTTTNEPCGGGRCSVQLQYQNSGKYLQVCAFDKSCHILMPDQCPDGFGCYVADVAQALFTCTNFSPSPKSDQQTCSFLNDCPDMEDCYDAQDGSGRICRYYCFLDPTRGSSTPGLGGCPSGQNCTQTFNGHSVVTGLPGVGLCFVP